MCFLSIQTRFALSALGLFLSASPVKSQGTITTFAGNGAMTFAGDGDLATSASLNHPSGLVADNGGSVFIADSDNHRLRRVSGGRISTVAGNGIPGSSGDGGYAANATFADLLGVAIDLAGNLYIADSGNHRVRKVTTGGIVTAVAGTGVQGGSGDGGPATNATLNRPTDVVLDYSGNLYICDSSNQNIRRVNLASGVITTYAGNGRAAFSGDGGQAASASLQFPLGVATDQAGNLYIADAGNNRIRKVNSIGVIGTVAGGGTGPALNTPSSVIVDAAGSIFIADSGNNRVRKIDGSNGSITTIAGGASDGFSGDGGPATSALLSFPWGLAIDPAANLYVADRINNRVRKITGVSSSALPLPPATSSSTIPTGPPGTPIISKVANAEGESPTIAPNTWVEIQGRNLAPPGDSRIWQGSDFAGNQMPVQLDKVSATVNGKNAYVYYISPTQINILTAPDSMSGPVQVVVTNNGAASASFTAQTQPISPSFFVFDGVHVAAVHANRGLIGPASLYPGSTTPAKPGEVIAVYANGFGPTNVPIGNGAITQSGTLSPLPVVKIGGLDATVQFAGLVLPGEFQFNVIVPPATPDGDQPITATYNGSTTQSGTVVTIQR